jgi:hypothetical protein
MCLAFNEAGQVNFPSPVEIPSGLTLVIRILTRDSTLKWVWMPLLGLIVLTLVLRF